MATRVEAESDGISAAVRSPSHRFRSNDGSDFISSLPDAILHHILSYIPTEYAIRTSALSKRWKHVWRETPSLSFQCHASDHPDSQSKTLATFAAPKITSFDMDATFNNFSLTSSHVRSWIQLAVSRHAEKISLVVIGSGSHRNVFPDLFFTNSSVKELSLTLGRGGYDYPQVIPPNCTVLWTSLKNLSLECCGLPDESLASILSGCPMLESLVLKLCEKLRHIDLSKSLKLTRLEITGKYYGPSKIVAPYIRFLKLTGSLDPCTLVDVSSLTDVRFTLSYIGRTTRDDDFHQDMLLKMLEKFQNVEKLTIGPVVLQVLSVAELRGLPFPQLQAKSLTVVMMVVRSVIPGLARLLQNSPGLQKITVNTIYYKGIQDAELDRHLRTQGLNPDQCWRLKHGDFSTTEKTYPSSSYGVVAKLAKSKDVVSFIKLVLQNSKTVDTMVLRLGGYLNATEYQKLLRVVPTFTRNKNVRTRGQAKRLLNVLKIIHELYVYKYLQL